MQASGLDLAWETKRRKTITLKDLLSYRSQSVAGADASATLYSLIESAKLNGIGTYDYLLYLFKKIPHCQNIEDYEKLLPYNIDPILFKQA